MTGKILKKTAQTVSIPLVVFCVLTAVCMTQGVSLFQSGESGVILVRGIATTMLTTMALSVNFSSGRFDFSLGSMMTLSSVISAQLCLRLDLGAEAMLVFSILAGVLLGLLSGLLYIALRISPLICSLGVTLLYEGVSFALTGGANVSFMLNTRLISFSKNPVNLAVIIAAVLVLMILLFEKTRFGYNYKALSSGQKVAVNTGIREIPNALVCYALSGLLMGIVGFITASQMGYIEAGKLNFGSIGIMFTAFLPMFLGSFIGRFSNDKLGFLLGAACTTLIGLAYSALQLSTSMQSIITALLLVLFLVYLSNEQRIRRFFGRKHTLRGIPA